MSKHKSEDYKISAINYYLDNDKSIKRYNIKPISYKITKLLKQMNK